MISTVVGLISLTFAIVTYLSRQITDLNTKIITGLNLVPSCGFSEEKTFQIKATLLDAQRQLNLENHYDTAKSLYDSVYDDLVACTPLHVDPTTLLIGALALLTLLSLIHLIRPH